MVDYSKKRASADASIRRAGLTMTLSVVPEATAADPDRPWEVTESAPVTYSAAGVLLDYLREAMPATEVQVGDRRLLLSALDTLGVLLPQPTPLRDYLTDDSGTWSIQGVRPLAPGGVVVLFDLHVRR